jgi:hypothetical protein
MYAICISDARRINERNRQGAVNTMMNRIRRLSLLWRLFTPLEEFLLDVLQRELPDEAREINQRRIDLINHVSRPLAWTEIMFYQMRKGKVVAEEELLFRCRSRQCIVLAKIRFSPDQSPDVWTSEIHAVCGHMFSVTTRPSPMPISFCRSFTLRSVRLVDDAMMEFPPTLLERLCKRLPPDFERFAGRSVSGWAVFDRSNVYTVHLEDGDYLVFAELDGAASYLTVMAEGKSKSVYYLPHDEPPRRVGSTLEEAIEMRRATKRRV